MITPTTHFHARICPQVADKLDAWMKEHNMTKPRALVYLAAKAGVITQAELMQALGVPAS